MAHVGTRGLTGLTLTEGGGGEGSGNQNMRRDYKTDNYDNR